jgi:phosphate-selective porin OprO/OprP
VASPGTPTEESIHPRRTALGCTRCARISFRAPILALATVLVLVGPPFRSVAGAEDAAGSSDKPKSQLAFDVDWPGGITYELRKVTPSLETKPALSHFGDLYLLGRIGARLDLDGAVFAVEDSLRDFDNDFRVRRARFYLTGDFSLGIPLAYKFEFSFEGTEVFLNDFFVRWKPPRWVDSVDFGYLTPPMGLENVVSSRTLTFMEVAAPVQALAPGFRSGIALAGHHDPRHIAWKLGFFSAGQEQISGDASDTSAQFVGRLAWLPWRRSPEPDAALFHLGLSTSLVLTGNSTIRYRARPESFIAPFVVDTGDTPADNALQFALEGAWSSGPLLVSSEMLSSSVEASNGEQYRFYGMYGLVSWMLTGEHHPYDGRTGLFTRPAPHRPFSFRARQWGAFEVGQRASWLDLNDDAVRGGKMLTLTSSLTWYLNQELKFFANYVFAHVTDGPERGDANIFQIRIEVGI